MITVLEAFGPVKAGGHVGIEIEVEGENLPNKDFDVWSVKADGSLKGEAYEYVTKGPVTLNNLPKAMENLNAKFLEKRSVVHNAHRASVHIHVNVQDRDVYELFGVLFAWSMIERVWMRLCGETREKNLFCLPSSQSGHQIEYAKKLLKCFRESAYYRLPEKGKYDALNFDPVGTLGSVEFRTFATSIQVKDIVRWADWCTRLVNYGCDVKRNDLTKEWKKVFEDPMILLDSVFGEDVKDIPKEEAFNLVKAGCEDASDLALVWANHKIAKVLADKGQAEVYKFAADMANGGIFQANVDQGWPAPRPPRARRALNLEQMARAQFDGAGLNWIDVAEQEGQA